MERQKSFTTENKGMLYIVGTPIGNLGDMSERAQEVLREVDLIAAEDTRHTRKLLNHFQLSTPMVSYHEHNELKRGAELVEKLKEGMKIALVSDAGLPGISDPGEEIVGQAVAEGIPVVPIPGPNAALTALVASGLPAQPFLFLGFLPRASKERKVELEKWKASPATLLFYEAPHRLIEMLTDLLDVLGNRRAAITRELTKKHEEWLRGKLVDCLSYVKEQGPRGEYTIVIEGAGDEAWRAEEPDAWWEGLSLAEHVHAYMSQGNSKKEAISQTAKDRALPKREVYNMYHKED
ncbi:16S rRNA (cytidine(1402)-2'-O)-methyltransferase [Laceyella putida]|uniref:Ribosomal RNA small subunit methyltransferase I n=1 Tax=Laceyella putida TaxID=110101 RepID=A0ABW2RQQ9_9BACL